MAHTACTVKNIKLMTVANGLIYEGGIDRNGNELDNIQLVADLRNLPTQRTYICDNCGGSWDGSESFDEVKKHFGTFPLD